jgi:TusA-related sulfurtransferase
MSDTFDPAALASLAPDHTFDGGDLDCGSGLALLIREQMLAVAEGGVLEIRSSEPTVRGDLPPWCRLSGHAYLGALEGDGHVRYFVRRGAGTSSDAESLEKDKERARTYEWRARVRVTGAQKSTVYCRNFSFDVGQPASFEEKDAHPSALEYLLGALAGALAAGFSTECSRDGIEIDDVEATVRGSLHSPLAVLGLDEGDPGLERATLILFVSTLADAARVRAAWERAVARSPIAATLRKAAALELKISIV